MYVSSPPVWTAPESGGRQPRIHHDLNDTLLLGPQKRWIAGELLKHTVQEGTVASCSDLKQAPRNQGRVQQVPTTRTARMDAATSGGVDNAAAPLREKNRDLRPSAAQSVTTF